MSVMAKLAMYFLADVSLPSFISLVSAMPAYEYIFTSRTTYKLNSYHHAKHHPMPGNRQ
jgi:hypothetical protein